MAKKKAPRISKWDKAEARAKYEEYKTVSEVFDKWLLTTARRMRVYKLWSRLVGDQHLHPEWWKAIDAEYERLTQEDDVLFEEYLRIRDRKA